MYVPGENDVINEQDTYKTGESQTDRVNGEYHYRNGYTQKIYSDAHYVREEDNTVPPRYYTPPKKPTKEPKIPRNSCSVGNGMRTLCLCLVCAILGGISGAAMMGAKLNNRMTTLESSVEELQAEPEQSKTGVFARTTNTDNGEVNASAIYDEACQQVVGVTTEITHSSLLGTTSSSSISGTGFIVTQDGYILTNYHVISKAYGEGLGATVVMHDGSSYEASIVGVEESNDIAVLKIDATNLSAVNIGDSSDISVGDMVYTVGNPLGELDFSMSVGYVSALDRSVKTDEEADAIDMFQIDAAVNSGNSGGPVYNSRGEVIGVVTAKYSDTGVEGIGFAIPINDAASIANDLITEGYVTGKAYMGVGLDERYNAMYSQYYGMPLGAYVYSVEAGSCAESAGVQAGDIITGLGSQVIEDYDDLRTAVKSYSAGDTTEIRIYRAGDTLELSITFDELLPDSLSDSPVALQLAG
jgi:serine protease Do